MKKSYIYLVFFFYNSLLFSQGFSGVVSPSSLNIKTPQAYEFERQGNIPTNLYTGTINYGVPLFEFSKNGDNYINLSLSYNSSGFIPNKKTNYVGYNWSLNFGGSITRSVNQEEDEKNHQRNPGGSINISRRIPITADNLYKGNYTGVNDKLYIKDNIYYYEINPDKFNFNFNGHSGYFYIGSQGPVIVSYQEKKLEIEINESLLPTVLDKGSCSPKDSQIIIKDDNGNKYYFGGNQDYLEASHPLGSVGDPKIAGYLADRGSYTVNTWYLNKVEYNNGDNVKYNYKNINLFSEPNLSSFCYAINTPPNKTRFGEAQYLFDVNTYYSQNIFYSSFNIPFQFFLGGGYGYSTYGDFYAKTNYSVSNKVFLKEIISNDFKISLDYSKNEGNGNNFGKYMLSDVTVKNSQDSIIKKVNLNYYDKGEYKFLKEVKINNQSPYKMEYYNIDNLPPINTKGIDFWGFWNGKDVNNSLIPKFRINTNTGDLFIESDHRDANPNFANIGLLKKVIYPTQGSSLFEYESNLYSKKVTRNSNTSFFKELYFEYNSPYNYTGGARIKKIISNDGINDEIKEYTYFLNFSPYVSNPTYLSSGILLSDNKIASYVKEEHNSSGSDYTQELQESAQSIFPDILSGSHIAYSEVQEYINGKIYRNTNFTDYETNPDTEESYRTELLSRRNYTIKPITYHTNIIKPYKDNDYQRGKVNIVTSYDDNGKQLSQDYYHYESLDNIENYVTKVFFHNKWSKWHNFFKFNNTPHVLISTTNTHFFNNENDIIDNYTRNEYKIINKKVFLNKQTTTNSKGETLTTEYQYPPDLVGQESYMKELTDANRIAEPVVVKQNVSGTYISEVHNQYNLFNGIVQKSAVHQKKGKDINVNTPTDRKITYNSYDSKGNLTQYTLENGIPVAIIWGYGGQYPIAKIEGVSYTNLTNSNNYTSNIINALIYQTTNYPQDIAPIKDLFNQLRVHDLCKDSMITTYIYKPLIGVTSITAPNGMSEYYNYDEAGRLQSIVNDKKEVLKTFEYNYKQP